MAPSAADQTARGGYRTGPTLPKGNLSAAVTAAIDSTALAAELWPEVGDSLRKGWRIVVVMNPPHLQERSDTPCWTIQLLPCVRQGMLKIR